MEYRGLWYHFLYIIAITYWKKALCYWNITVTQNVGIHRGQFQNQSPEYFLWVFQKFVVKRKYQFSSVHSLSCV